MNWKKIKKDFLIASSSHFFYKVVGYFILTILTRYLAKDEMGEFFFAASLAGFFVMISELGINSYLTREIAREPEKALDFMSEVVSLRVPLYAGYFIILNVLHFFRSTLSMLWCSVPRAETRELQCVHRCEYQNLIGRFYSDSCRY
jgi:O-antigen/teichoic acid export membrane protein